MILCESLLKLPKDVVENEIFKFLNNEQLLFTNKKYYEKTIIEYRLKNNNFSYKKNGLKLDCYIKKIIINKYNYIFSLLIKEKYKHWKKIKGYYYKDYRYKSYIDVLKHICIELDSTKCRNTILLYEKSNGVRKNKYKKMRSINNIWSN
tara:strand:+ start:61 stop:507 length:447 start_codon:yes stop_codon:yes gene_type:complete